MPGNEAFYVPLSKPQIFRDRVVPIMQIHRSVSRVISRSTTATFLATTTKHACHEKPLLGQSYTSYHSFVDRSALVDSVS